MEGTNQEYEDEFWSVAMIPSIDGSANSRLGAPENLAANSDDEDDGRTSVTDTFTIMPPAESSESSLALSIHADCNDGVMSDVAGIPWDASLLLGGGFLYGTPEGRRLCHDACFGVGDDAENCGGVLELGSGLGIVGLAAVAAAFAEKRTRLDELNLGGESEESSDSRRLCCRRVVLTDLNHCGILSNLRRNVRANLDKVADASSMKDLHVDVEPCDWVDVSRALQMGTNSLLERTQCEKLLDISQFPRGPFDLVLGSALVYLPEHARACADTLYYYLTCQDDDAQDRLDDQTKRQAVILQLPDRTGFSTHFLPRCRELGLAVSCRELDKELIGRVQSGWKRRIPSASDYRLYFITAGR